VEAQREPIESISAVTLLTVNMVEAVVFYEALGFHLLYGGPEAPFTSFRVGAGYLNLELDTVGSPRRAVWGRVVFWVDDVDAMYRRALAAGFDPETCVVPPTRRGLSGVAETSRAPGEARPG
jgi:catechol 2,3-dioxygenase-like lactoylglutathione lyase family enzyme